MSNQKRFHIWFGNSRTTITVDTILFELMAIKLKHQPDDENAHYVVREWIQDTIVSNLGEQPGRKNATQWTRRYLIEAIADKRLASKRDDWIVENI
ncbi:hypothetical protein N9850_14555 [Granulosicoccus sp.]|nr:hypothetical protein [Granulosicoccus sp.]MDB4224983.1 hypothetical protein [Granulosicoccus sp.]